MPVNEVIRVCKARDGELFTASEELSEVLVRFDGATINPEAIAYPVEIGTTADGSAYAQTGDYRIVVNSSRFERPYSKRRRTDRLADWRLFHHTEEMPEMIERVLCHALGIPVWTFWTAEEILAREG